MSHEIQRNRSGFLNPAASSPAASDVGTAAGAGFNRSNLLSEGRGGGREGEGGKERGREGGRERGRERRRAREKEGEREGGRRRERNSIIIIMFRESYAYRFEQLGGTIGF